MPPLPAAAILLAALATLPMPAAPAPANQVESKVPPYTLPDPLVAADGTPVRDAATWRARRRPELLELFTREVYGRAPAAAAAVKVRAEVTAVDRAALGGAATRKEVTLHFGDRPDGPRLHLLIYQPNGAKTPPPVFLGLNFNGNHTVHADPGITLADPHIAYDVARYRPLDPQPATKPEQRGSHADKWLIETVLARGYATATAWCHDLCPDRADGLGAGVPALFSAGGTEGRAGDAWGALGVWAWGLSRALDHLETDRELDARRVAVHGFSRLGKAAAWAGAQDERFAALISNESGCGGAALSKRIYGETVAIINHKFPHWFAKNFRAYDDREAALPLDQHELLALVAPRALYVASAVGDQWSDPKGEFLALRHAAPVWRLFGAPAFAAGATEPPPPNRPVAAGPLAYHLREGQHDLTAYDWAQYLDFADRIFARP